VFLAKPSWRTPRMETVTGVALLMCGMFSILEAHAQTTIRYIHTDSLGSPVAITDINGSLIESEFYEPYGSSTLGIPDNSPSYAGHVSDEQTGLIYMQQRYMDPQLGIFLSVDPVSPYQQQVGQSSRYRYANSNPYRFSDPTGRIGVGLEDKEPAPEAPPPEPETLATVLVVATRPIPMPAAAPVPWLSIAGRLLGRVSGPLALLWPTPMGASPCELPGGPPCGVMMSGAFPPGYWPADSGSAEWGRRNGVGAREGTDRFHKGVKENTPGTRGDHDFGVNPETGDVIDQNGELVGNLNDE